MTVTTPITLVLGATGNIGGQLSQPFETLLGEEVRQHVARGAEAELTDAVEDVFRIDHGGEPPVEPELALAGATPATVHAAQGLKEKTMVDSEGLEPPTFAL
ncbi:MAG: hypothetical protein EXQ71_08795 [Acidimicrobiia bacterium]|nr:hypothetical protein [Acidimicrobiia bacterium]